MRGVDRYGLNLLMVHLYQANPLDQDVVEYLMPFCEPKHVASDFNLNALMFAINNSTVTTQIIRVLVEGGCDVNFTHH
jgi:hypothetical protein